VLARESVGNQNFDSLAHELSTRIPKHAFDLIIQTRDPAVLINNNDRIGSEPKKCGQHFIRTLEVFGYSIPASSQSRFRRPRRSTSLLMPGRLNRPPSWRASANSWTGPSVNPIDPNPNGLL
jgi:hypothetical protein